MGNIFDKKNPFQQVLSGSELTAQEEDRRLQKWFRQQTQRLKENPGLQAAGAAPVLLVNSLRPQEATVDDPKHGLIVTVEDEGKTARITAQKLPRNVPCLILLLDETAFEEIRKYLAPDSPEFNKAELAKRLFMDKPGEFDLHKLIILTTLPSKRGESDEARMLDVTIPIPQGFRWNSETFVIIAYDGSERV